MKKYFIHLLLVSIVFVMAFSLSFQGLVTPANAQTMTISQLVELLITIGAIPADKVVAARAVATQMSTTVTIATTSPAGYVQVLTPNGGESWEWDLDIPYSITWGSSNETPVNISLVNSKGIVCRLNPLPLASKRNITNVYRVLIKTSTCTNVSTGALTPIAEGSYKARVSYADNSGTSDDSNTTFKILPVPIPSVKVSYPNGGETLTRNTSFDIKYTVKNVAATSDGLVYMSLLDSYGNVAYNSHKTFNTAGLYPITIPSNLSVGAYKVKLSLTDRTSRKEIEDSSDNFFWITL